VAPEAAVGWDLGGAHLKAARLDPEGRVERVVQLPCPLWRGLAHLDQALLTAQAAIGPARLHGVTMTGEMVDLFPTRVEGVAQLVAAMQERFRGTSLRFYAGSDGFLAADEAKTSASRVASANWLASAALVATCMRDALLMDIGSTTADLVVVRDGRIQARGRDDAGRLAAGELVYSGVVRTPVIALATAVPFEGESVPLIAELFATAADVHRLCGRLPEDADQHPAADGGEKTETGSARRLARLIGRDAETAPLKAWRQLARALARAQTCRFEDACDRLLSGQPLAPDVPVVAAGVGRFLVADVAHRLARRCFEFARLLPDPGPEPGRVSDCAPAVAVAWLMQRDPA
jgi:probable H4MPT-linked C1 transfer pathway protein